VLTICATLIVAAGVAMVWVRVVQTLTESSGPPRAVGQPGALVWDGRVFTSPGQLKAYLTSHGQSYSRWLARHPTAFGRTAPTVRHHAATKTTPKPKPTKTAAKPKPKPTKTAAKPTPKPAPVTPHVAAPATVSATKSKPLTSLVLTIMLLVGGLALGASAALPTRYTPVTVQHFYATPDRRMVALAAATAILLGFGVSFYLT
jgi:hypothetical protein